MSGIVSKIDELNVTFIWNSRVLESLFQTKYLLLKCFCITKMTETSPPPNGGIADYFLLFGSFVGTISSICCLYYIEKKLKINHVIKKLLLFAGIQDFLGYGIVFSSMMLIVHKIKNKITCFMSISSFGVTMMGKQLVHTMISIIRFLLSLFLFILLLCDTFLHDAW